MNETSPVIHADENDRLAKFNGPSDNTSAIVSAEPNFKTGVEAKEKETDAEVPPIWKPPPNIHWGS